MEENLSRQARRQRKHVALQEEKKLRELQHHLGERRNSQPAPASAPALGRGEPPSWRGLTQLMWVVGTVALCHCVGNGLAPPACLVLCLMLYISSSWADLLPGFTLTPYLPSSSPNKTYPSCKTLLIFLETPTSSSCILCKIHHLWEDFLDRRSSLG